MSESKPKRKGMSFKMTSTIDAQQFTQVVTDHGTGETKRTVFDKPFKTETRTTWTSKDDEKTYKAIPQVETARAATGDGEMETELKGQIVDDGSVLQTVKKTTKKDEERVEEQSKEEEEDSSTELMKEVKSREDIEREIKEKTQGFDASEL